MSFSLVDLAILSPALWLIAAALLVVGYDAFKTNDDRTPMVVLAFAGVIGAWWTLAGRLYVGMSDLVGFGGSMVLDRLSAYVGLAVVSATALILVAAPVDTRRRGVAFGEYYGLLLLASAGMVMLVQSADFLTMFINLEILSLALYVLTGITRRNPRANEAAVKYLVTGAFATTFLLMGVALIYGATGSIVLEEIGRQLGAGNASSLLHTGFGLVLVGFLFKIGAAPFHLWVPDVYEGAPTSTTAFMSVTVKAAGVATLARVLLTAAGSHPELWTDLLWYVAVATMVVGNLLAAQQQSVKRMLAFSSVAHTGYALIAFASLRHAETGAYAPAGAASVLFYLVTYTFMTLGAFMFLTYAGHEVARGEGRRPEWQDAESLDDVAGLAWRRPWAAAAMTLFLVSLGGLPPTAGFLGKYFVFASAVQQGHSTLAIIGVLASLVSWYYYLRVVVYLFMKEGEYEDEKPAAAVGWVLGLSAFATVAIGLMPSSFVEAAQKSIAGLL